MTVNSIYLVSMKRILLSWYIDLLIFFALWELTSYLLEWVAFLPFWAPYISLILIRAAASKAVGTPGLYFLSINHKTMEVDRYIYNQESSGTIIWGTLFISEGMSNLVRWIEFDAPQPMFGLFLDYNIQTAIQFIFGSAFIAAGYWMLKLNIKGLFLGITTLTVMLFSMLLSWQQWNPNLIAAMVTKRRLARGGTVRQEEIEFFQFLMPEVMVTIMVICILSLLYSYKKFNMRASPK